MYQIYDDHVRLLEMRNGETDIHKSFLDPPVYQIYDDAEDVDDDDDDDIHTRETSSLNAY